VHPQAAAMPKRQPQVSPVRRKVVTLLEKKNYRKAFELMAGRNREGLEREYIKAINGLLEVGDDAFSLGDYAAAARTFKGVLDAYPVELSLRERVSHDPKQIRSYLETCANRMMEQGLEEYRHGRLESAIRKWKGLLMFSPGHREAKKALDTATVQLQALQSLKNN
jgi:tetratricopeptide (TPR) repeat protein